MIRVILDFGFYLSRYIKNYHMRRFFLMVGRGISQIVSPVQIQNGFIHSNCSMEDFTKNAQILDKWSKQEKKSINSLTWFVPEFSIPHAGITNILSFLKFFLAKGMNVNIVLLGSAFGTSYCHYLIRKKQEFAWLRTAKIFENPRIDELPYTDAGVATRCDTAYSLLKFNNTKSKFYFIQDDERLLYQDKAQRDLAEATYRFGFTGITNAECLKEMYIKEFAGKGESYFPATDHMKLVPATSAKEIKRVFFYARPDPDSSRNGFMLGISGLREIRKRHPEIEIVAAGSAKKFDDHGLKIKQLGDIPHSQLQEFYSSCDVGIYILLSKHTGIIPFELMASGCAALTNRRPYKQSYLRDMENCIMFDLTPSSIADAFDILYHDRRLYEKVIANGQKFIAQMPTLEKEMERIYKFMTA